jgi:hypothetical protein
MNFSLPNGTRFLAHCYTLPSIRRQQYTVCGVKLTDTRNNRLCLNSSPTILGRRDGGELRLRMHMPFSASNVIVSTLQMIRLPQSERFFFALTEYAAAFFMLAGQPRDAIRICLRQMDDLEMAIMLARISDHRASHPDSGERSILELDRLDSERPVPVCGEMLREIIETTILPDAHKSGDRWLSHWAYWNLDQRGQAIRYLTLPLEAIGIEPEDSGQKTRGVLSGSADWVALYYELRRRYFGETGSMSLAEHGATAGWLTRVEEWDMVKHRCQRLWAMGKHALPFDKIDIPVD